MNTNRWMNSSVFLILLSCISLFASSEKKYNVVWLDDLKIKNYSDGIPSVSPKTTAGGDTMKMAGKKYFRGIGVQAISALSFFTDGHAIQFQAVAGPDDSCNKNISVSFYVIADRKILFDSGKMRVGDAPKMINIDLSGIKRLGLLVTADMDGQTRMYANWANARLVMEKDKMPQTIPNSDEKYILTPPETKEPKINSPKIFGATPGNPFLYSIATTGERPVKFSVKNLPVGLTFDEVTGIITGSVQDRGIYHAEMIAQNNYGTVSKPLKIVIGDTIALTPPMGWNGWNSWARDIDREKVILSAKAMVSKGLKNHGWTYVNIDDCWQGQRGGKWNALQANEKFPRFREMIDTIHTLGLKAGVYSTPWITSYAGYPGASSDNETGIFPDSLRHNKRAYRYAGKYRFEKEDALQMADWGVDYLKYDWRIDQNAAERMARALRDSGRDIFYSISNSAPFDQAGEWSRMCNSWRTGPDIRDSWLSLYISAFTIDKWASYAGPGHWNDPDMLIIGNVTTGSEMHPTRLTPDEQYSHVSLFCLLAAPLLIGCPVDQLDDFTLNLISNNEAIAINQDILGKPGRLVREKNGVQVWVKPLENNGLAVGLFNTDNFMKTPESFFRWGDEKSKLFFLNFQEIGLKEKYNVHDVWRQKDLGVFEGNFPTQIRYHGVILLKLTPANEDMQRQ